MNFSYGLLVICDVRTRLLLWIRLCPDLEPEMLIGEMHSSSLAADDDNFNTIKLLMNSLQFFRRAEFRSFSVTSPRRACSTRSSGRTLFKSMRRTIARNSTGGSSTSRCISAIMKNEKAHTPHTQIAKTLLYQLFRILRT